MAALPGPRWLRWTLGAAAALGALGVVFVSVTFVQVWMAADDDQAGPADAIVVLGAAQYDGAPSPVLRARLDHALELWEAGHAPLIVVTGGNQRGDRYTQAAAGYLYLRREGVPDESLLLEVDGTSTYSELAATARILRNRGLSRALMVSDGYHSRRLLEVAAELGLEGTVSPTDTEFGVRDLLRETAAVSAGRLVGFRRLDALG